MRSLLPAFLACFLTFTLHAQKLVPGKNLGKIKLGMTKAQVTMILGSPEKTNTYEEELKNYQSSGYETEKELVFFLGFDEVYRYDNSATSTTALPVFKAYFKDDKLIFLIVTSYGYAENKYLDIKFKKGLRFFANDAMVQQKYGAPTNTDHFGTEEKEMQYLTQGINLTMDEGQLRAVHLFQKLTQTQIDTYLLKAK